MTTLLLPTRKPAPTTEHECTYCGMSFSTEVAWVYCDECHQHHGVCFPCARTYEPEHDIEDWRTPHTWAA